VCPITVVTPEIPTYERSPEWHTSCCCATRRIALHDTHRGVYPLSGHPLHPVSLPRKSHELLCEAPLGLDTASCHRAFGKSFLASAPSSGKVEGSAASAWVCMIPASFKNRSMSSQN